MRSGEGRMAGVVAWVPVAVTVVLLVFTARLVIDSGVGAHRVAEFPGSLAFVVVGAAIVSRRRRNLIGWAFLAIGVSVAMVVAGQQYADRVRGELPLSGADWGAWLGTWPIELFIALLALVFLLFPDGRLSSPRWRAVAWLTAGTALMGASISAISDVNLTRNFPDATHPLTLVRPSIGQPVYETTQLVAVALMVAAVVRLVFRLRRARGDERQQLRWVAYAAAITASAVTAGLPLGIPPLVTYHLFVPSIPIATAVAIWKYRLYAIDVVVNRTVVYGALTALIAAAFGASVSLASAFVGANARRGASLLVAGLIAVLFGPLRQRVQRTVDRLMYGQRDDPYEVISRVGHRLGTRLAPGAVLPEFAETVAGVLRLPYVAIQVREEDGYVTAASYGTTRGLPIVLALVHQGEAVGHLLVSRRAPGEELSQVDKKLLDDLARQVAMVVHTLRLTAELQRSREQLVNTREEERRRLRRDLHDGLGPALAGVALQLENAEILMEDDPAKARGLMDKLRTEIQAVLADVRRLVYELRPPALDELGLVGALRQLATQFTTGSDRRDGKGFAISVEAPAELNGLPAAVEVAAYRIATEAITNASRHAGARQCTVSITVGRDLELEVIDDGFGIRSDAQKGVGLTSMRERADELGGASVVEALTAGGTRVWVRLPVGSA